MNMITNFMGHDLTIIVVWNLFLACSYGTHMNIIHLLVLFEHRYCAHCLYTNVICVFVLFKHKCCIYSHVVYTWKSCTWLLCLHNAQHLCLNNTNIWNKKFHIDLKWTHKTYKFVVMMITLTWNKHKKMNMITMMTLSKHMNMTMTIALNKHMKTNMTRTNKTQFAWMCKKIILKTWEKIEIVFIYLIKWILHNNQVFHWQKIIFN
jgi:hypothetical protein